MIALEGGLTLPRVPSWQTDSGRLKRIGSGQWAITAAGQPRVYVESGVLKGVLIEPAGVLKGIPVHQALPSGSTSPQHVTKSIAGSTVEHANQHSLPDMFGGTGKGIHVVATTTSSNFYFTNNQTAVVAGDKIRASAILYVQPTGATQEWRLGWNALSGTAPTTTTTLVFDASGGLSSATAPAPPSRGGCFLLDTLPGGQKLYFAWVEHTITTSATLRPNLRGATVGGDARIQGMHTGLNLANYVPSLPVYEDKTFLADGVKLSNDVAVEVEFVGLACGRTRIEPGAAVTAPVTAATPSLPLETQIVVRPSVEATNADFILPSPTMDLAINPLAGATTHSVTLGPGFFDIDVTLAATITDYSILSAFSATERRAFIRSLNGGTGNTTVTVGVHLWSRTQTGNINTYVMQPKGGTWTLQPLTAIFGCARSHTRDYAGAIADDLAFGGERCEYYGRVGGTLSSDFTLNADQVEMGYLTTALTAFAFTTTSRTQTVNLTNSFVHDTTADMTTLGNAPAGWNTTGNLYFRHTYRSLDFVQSQDQIEVDEGSGRVPLSASSFTASTLPIGRKFSKYGTRAAAGAAVTLAPDQRSTLYVTDWGARSGITSKPGYQYYVTRPRRVSAAGVETEIQVVDFEVYVSDNGKKASPSNPHIYITTQNGKWIGASYSVQTAPAQPSAGIHGDTFQSGNNGTTLNSFVAHDNIVMTKSQGFFLRSQGEGVSGASVIKAVDVARNIILSGSVNALTLFGPNDATAKAMNSNLIAPLNDRERFSDGSAVQPSIIVDGATAQPSGSGNVVAVQPGATGVSATNGGVLPGYSTIGAYGALVDAPIAATGTVTTDHIFDESCLDPVSRRPLLDFDKLKFTPLASALLGFDAQGLVETIRAGVYSKNATLRSMVVAWSQPPTHRASVAASAAVGAVVLTGLKGKTFDRKYGGNARGYFKLEGGKITVAKALTGLNRLFLLINDAGERIIVDVS